MTKDEIIKVLDDLEMLGHISVFVARLTQIKNLELRKQQLLTNNLSDFNDSALDMKAVSDSPQLMKLYEEKKK